MKKLLLAGLIALFANASEIDLLKVATDGKVSGKSYLVAEKEAKNVKAGYISSYKYYYPYYGKMVAGYLTEKKGYMRYAIIARKLRGSNYVSVWMKSYNTKTRRWGYAYDLYSRYLLSKYRDQIISKLR